MMIQADILSSRLEVEMAEPCRIEQPEVESVIGHGMVPPGIAKRCDSIKLDHYCVSEVSVSGRLLGPAEQGSVRCWRVAGGRSLVHAAQNQGSACSAE